MRWMLLLIAATAWGQRVESRAQMLSGTGLPGVCVVGERFFKTDAPLGANLYGCTSTNTWTAMTGGLATGLCRNPLGIAKTSGTVLTINGECATAPAVVGVGSASYQFTSAPTLTISGTSSTGTVYVCLSSAAALVAKHNLAATISPSAGITVQTGQTSCGTDFTLHAPTMTSNVWDTVATSMDFRPQLYFKPHPTAGTNITIGVGNSDTITASGGGSSNAGAIVWGLGFQTMNTGTWYTWPGYALVNVDSYAGVIPVGCDATNLRVYVPAAVNAGGNIVATLRNVTAGADTALTVTISAGASAGVYSDTVNTVALTGGSRYVLKIDNNSTASNSGGWAFAFQCK